MIELDFPGCGAADEYGHPIMCEDCIWGETCIDSTKRMKIDRWIMRYRLSR
jgi:hypothetical protein